MSNYVRKSRRFFKSMSTIGRDNVFNTQSVTRRRDKEEPQKER